MPPPPQNPAGNNPAASKSDWATIIASIRTPLGYFALALLIIDSLLVILVTKATGFDLTLLSISIVIILFCIIIIVGYIVYKRPDALTSNPANDENKNPANTDQFRRELLNDGIIKSIEYIARNNHDDYVRIACAHTVWSCRPDRAKPLLEDAKGDMAEVVRIHAKEILVKCY